MRLEWYEVRHAAQVGIERNVQAIKDHRAPSAAFSQTRDGAWEIHVQGACGELAFAKAANLFWNGSINTFADGGDVGRIEVRTRSKSHYDLIVRPHDSDEAAWVLVTGVAPEFEIHGWIRGRDAKRPEFLQSYGGRTPAFFVPQSELLPLDELGRRVAYAQVAA